MHRVFILIIVTLGFGCQTVVVPLYGIHVNRAKSGTQNFGIDVKSGTQTAPEAQGVAEAVTNSDGDVINPIPEDEESTVPLPGLDIGVKWHPAYSFGYSTVRGFYALWDVVQTDYFAWTITPAYAQGRDLNPDEVETCDQNEDGSTNEDSCETIEVSTFSGRLSNFNFSTMASVSPFGEGWWYDLALYGGVGANYFTIEIEEESSGESAKKSDVAPTTFYGAQFKITMFEVVAEQAVTTVTQRDGRKDRVTTQSFLAGFSLDLYGRRR